MFGCVVCNKKELDKDEIDRYQSYYCGLCRALKKRYGQWERLSLSYDMTFLALFLDDLYEEEDAGAHRNIKCFLHPFSRKSCQENPYLDYAADMTVLLAYYKSLDDWEDERKKTGYLYSKMLAKKLTALQKKYPRQCRCVEQSIQKLNEIEKKVSSPADEAVNCSGEMLSELFVYKEDFWSDSLRHFGYELGRFVYLMDAVLDYKDDVKSGNYNPLVQMGKKPEQMQEILTMVIGNAAAWFEKFPIVQDVHLLQNVLYDGVWIKYDAQVLRKEEKKEEKAQRKEQKAKG